MGVSNVLDLPEEMILQIVRHVEWRSIHSLRLVSEKLALIARHRLHSHLYLSSHGPDIKLFQRVVADQDLVQGVTELVFDDTTFRSRLHARDSFDTISILRFPLLLNHRRSVPIVERVCT